MAYARERFPLAAYLPMIAIASVAAVSWSRAAADLDGLPPGAIATAAATLLAGFFTLRVADEHKDAEDDRLHRPELPVPRGLVSLGELRLAAALLVAVAVAANVARSPWLLLPSGAAALWLTLMTREFFARDWLRARPALYLASHMAIMPLLLLSAAAAEWVPRGGEAPAGLPRFLAATYLTGLVLEVGRKIRAPGEERPGVETYTAAWGRPRAIAVWMLSLAGSAGAVVGAGLAAGSRWTVVAAPAIAIASAIPAIGFASRGDAARGKTVEAASGGWTVAAYLLLVLPWAERALR